MSLGGRFMQPDETPVMREQREFAAARHINILMPASAHLLQFAVRLAAPKQILEIGTAIGYSGLLMLGSAPDAHLTTVEIDEESLVAARGYFQRADAQNRVTTHLGDARQIVPMLPENAFDFILLDGPKSAYIDFLPYLLRSLGSGGTLFADNVLYKGWVSGTAEPPKRKHDTIIRRLDEFLIALQADPALVTVVLDIGDGVAVAVKHN